MKSWEFPHGEGLIKRGVNDPGVNSFLNNIADSLTREIIQNSLDAKNKDNDDAVIVEFNFTKIKVSQIPGIRQIIEDALPKAKRYWQERKGTQTIQYLTEFEEFLKKDEIEVLKISDFNTFGLNEESYDALVLSNGDSVKSDVNSAGSKGIGKAAPLAASELRMVFYNSVPMDGIIKSAGVLNFVSFAPDESKEKDITQERALFLDSEKDYIEGQYSLPGEKIREENEFGTDIFIFALKQIGNWKDEIFLSVVNNFLISLLNDNLKIVVDGQMLDKDSLEETLNKLQKLSLSNDQAIALKNTLNYYDAMINEEHLELNLDEKFLKYDFINSTTDAVLYLLKRDVANRMILQTRQSGMRIYDRKSISGTINFTGVFQATGSSLDVFLKTLEDTNHTTWSDNQVSGKQQKIARRFLKDLFQWFKNSVKKHFEIVAEEEIEAFGLKDFLPMSDSDQNNVNNSENDSGIINSIDKFKIVKPKQKPLKSDLSFDGDAEDNITEGILESFGVNEDGDTERNSSDGNDSKETSKTNRKKNKRSKSKKERRLPASQYFKVKIISTSPQTGDYRLVGVTSKRIPLSEVEMSYVGADGKNYSVNIIDVKSDLNKVNLNDNGNVRIEKLGKLGKIDISFKVDTKLMLKMEDVFYEIKK